MSPEVSVIIPTHNRCAMLREAVGSVIAQRDVALELIIIDDGSTDGTWDDLHRGELARAISRAPATCAVIAERTCRRGPAAARNRGVALASADYIAFLDSDDLWEPQKLSHQLAYMRSHQEYPLAQTQESWIRNGRQVNPGLRHLKHSGDIFEPSLRTCLISPSAVMMRAELFRRDRRFRRGTASLRGLRSVVADSQPLSCRSARRTTGHPARRASRSALGHYAGARPVSYPGIAEVDGGFRPDQWQTAGCGRSAGGKM